MNSNFTISTNKLFLKIPLFLIVFTVLYIIRFIIYRFTPDTELYILIWKITIAIINGLFFGWYFYMNKKWVLGLVTHLLFVLFALQIRLSDLIDYYLSIDNSGSITTIVITMLFIISASWFTFSFFKTEQVKPHAKTFAKVFLLVIATYLVVANGIGRVGELFQQIIRSDSSFFEYFVHLIIILISVIKKFVLLIGFYYLLSKILNPNNKNTILAPQYISKKFFSQGFIISYTLIFLVFFSVLEDVFSFIFFSFFSRDTFDFYENLQLLSHFAYLLFAVWFLGQLIQYRSYSLKHFYGIFSAVALFPILNCVTLFLLRYERKVKSITDFIKNTPKQRDVHIGIYIVLMIAFFTFINKDEFTNEDGLIWIILSIILHSICLYIVSIHKKYVYVAPAFITLIWIIKNHNSFSFIDTITEKVFNFSILLQGIYIIIIHYLVYYLLFYIYHKAFFVEKNKDHIKQELEANFSAPNASEVL